VGGAIALLDLDYIKAQEYERLSAKVDVLTQKQA